jgi:hypothetical protein
LGIVVFSWFYRTRSSIIPFFAVALHEPVRVPAGCSLRRSRSATQLNVGHHRPSKGVTERYKRLMALAGACIGMRGLGSDRIDGAQDLPFCHGCRLLRLRSRLEAQTSDVPKFPEPGTSFARIRSP